MKPSTLTLFLLAVAVLLGLRTAPAARGEPDDGVTWVCKGPKISGINVSGGTEEGKFLPPFSGSETSATFADPDGKNSGSATWKAVKLALREGETVDMSLSASKFMATFEAFDCAEGAKLSFRRGVRDPWDPPSSSQTFSFVFRPKPGRKQVWMSVVAKPSQPGPYSNCGVSVVWLFERGAAVQTDEPAALSVTDYREFWNPAREAQPPAMADLAKKGVEMKGVAADGVSLLLLRAVAVSPGIATFSLDGAGGALFPQAADRKVFESAGQTTVDVPTEALSEKEHVALALYRPPTSFGEGDGAKDIVFSVSFMTQGGGPGPRASVTKKLVRPPVVLVHGTYDNPKFCYEDHDEADDTPTNLGPLLRASGFDVFTVDWEETNGSKDPSAFTDNEKSVWENKNGIRDALAAMRGKLIAATQADLVCHSQGGVISRVYARGFPLYEKQPPREKDRYGSNFPYHFSDIEECRRSGCWYHRADNYSLGDIHRLITISSTHRGSDVCRLFKAFEEYPSDTFSEASREAVLHLFCAAVDKYISGVTTGGFNDQVPGSKALKAIGPTPVPAHAIACCATDDDMAKMRLDGAVGDYYGRLLKVWLGTSDEAKDWAFTHLADLARENEGDLAPAANADEYKRLNAELRKGWDPMTTSMAPGAPRRKLLDPVINQMRKTVFRDDENDCTVSVKSSYCHLEPPFRSRIEHVLHGWAPRYRKVQERVLELLQNDGSLFDPEGFPDPYTDLRAKSSGFYTRVDRQGPPPAPRTEGPVRKDPAAGEDEEEPPPVIGPRSPPPAEPARPVDPGRIPAAPTGGAWTGRWDTGHTWGAEPLILTQSGKDVTGTFANGKGTITGTLSGNVLTFTFKDERFRSSGSGTFTLSDDGKSMAARYVEDGDPDKLRMFMQATRL